MHERPRDTMAHVRQYGHPDVLITFSCKINWKLQNELLEEKSHVHGHDLIFKVFKLKVIEMMDCFTNDMVIGSFDAICTL